MEEKKKGATGKLMEFAGGYKWLTVLGAVLVGASMIGQMAPYVCIWLVARDLVEVAPDWGAATMLPTYGWAACLVHVRRKFAEIVKGAGGDAVCEGVDSLALEGRRREKRCDLGAYCCLGFLKSPKQ